MPNCIKCQQPVVSGFVIHEQCAAVGKIKKWIDVEDKLPEQTKRVLVRAVFRNTKYATIGCLQKNKWLLEGAIKTATVTHWMELPEEPQ